MTFVKEIFIAGNVPSSKNSKVWTGKFLVHSKTVQKYIKQSKSDYEFYKPYFKELIKDKELPYKISFKFIRGSKHKFDYINPAQTVQDLMVKYEWIEDDNMTFMIPFFEPFEYNKEQPGVIIKIL
jgi:hypothetical protein|tara:strand:- start:2004 stop:2378 length:375 start_codon:yes stop_codon:yes gene_type:complete